MSDRRILVLLVAIATFFFADVLLLGNNFFFRDLFAYHYPMKQIVRDTIARGDFPWWNPYFGGGQPMAANPAYEVFYPPQWLIFIGSFGFGFALHIIFHVYLALIGMYLFLRSIPLRVEATMFGALSFAFSGFLLGTMTNLPTFFVWSWVGVVGWAVLRLIRGGGVAPAAIAMAMPLIVLDPVAVPQIFALVIAGTLIVDRRALPRVLAAMLIASAIAAVVIIPAIDHTHDSSRSRGFPYHVVVDYSMPPIRPIELLAPRAFGLNLRTRWFMQFFGERGTPYLPSIYCGVAVAILAIAGFIKRQRGALAVIAICAVSYVLAIGSASPLFRWMYTAGLHSIRYPEKFIAAGLVSLIVFASVCADRINEMRRVAAIVGVTIGLALLITGAFVATQMMIIGATTILAAIVAFAWAMVFWRAGSSRIWTLAALALLLLDLAWFSNQLLPRVPRWFFAAPSIAKELEPGATIFHRGEWTQEQMALDYERMSPALSVRNALRPLTPALWGFRIALDGDIDETYLLPTHDLLDAMVRRGNSGDPHWSEPFAAISNVRYIVDFKRGNIDHPIVVTRIPNRGRFSIAGGRILRVSETSSTADLDLETPSQAPLVIAITIHKYWHAFSDGRRVPLQRANIAYQSVMIPPGRHHVELRYRNPVILWSGVVSAIALIALIPRRRRPRSGS